jgi:hypothetical protein
LEATGGTILVGRRMLPEAVCLQSTGLEYAISTDRFACRSGDKRDVIFGWPKVFLEDPALLNVSPFAPPPPATPVRFDERYDRAVLWDEAHVLLTNRREALLFDLDGDRHRPLVFVADAGASRRRLDRPTYRGVVQVVADPAGGWLALLDGGTLARLTADGGEVVLRPTPVRRSAPAVEGCQVAEGRVLLVHRGESAVVADRVTNADLLTVPITDGLVALAPDGRTVATAATDRLSLVPVDRPTAGHSLRVPGGKVRQVAFAPDGLTVAVATAAGATVFDLG